MKSLSAKTFQCGVTVQGLTTLSGTVYLTALTNTATWDYVIVGTSAQGQLYTRTYAQLMSDVSSGITLSLDGLSDVVAPTPSTGQLLRYNGIQWANWTPTFYSLPAGGTTLQYIDGTGAFQTFPTSLPASSVKHQVKAGVAINKGQAVYVTSADGTNMIVGLASNTSEATSSKTMGLLDATVSTNGFANVVTEGLLAGLDTTAAGAEGDPVWLGTGGNLIYGLANKPYAPAHLVFIGIVTRKNLNNGEIFIKVQNGFELREIHDVDLITTVPVNGHILGFDGTLWVNKTIAGWLGYTPANASGTTNYISKFTGTNTLGNSSFYDAGTPTVWVTGQNANSRFYFSPVHADGRINFNAVANTNDYTLLRAWHDSNQVGLGTGSSAGGGALTARGDSILIGTSGALYFMNGTFGPNNVPYRLGITTSATATYFTSGVNNNLTNIESNEFIYTAKSHTFYTGTTTGNQSQPNQYTPLFLSTTGNVVVGSTTDSGYKFEVKNTSGSSALRISNNNDGSGMRFGISNGTNSQFLDFNYSVNLQAFAGYYMNLSVGSAYGVYLNSSNNVGIGTNAPAYKLDVSGTFRTLVGTETNPFRLEHTNGNYMTMVVGAGSALAAGQFGMYFNGTPMWSWNGAVFRLHGDTISTANNPSTLILQGGYGGSTVGTSIRLSSNTPNQGQWTATTGAQITVEVGNHSNETWAPTSGNASYTLLSIAPRINTTGTYAGIVTGFVYNPTLTSVTGVTHRAIHTVTGDVILGSTSGNVGIGTTSPSTRLHISGSTDATQRIIVDGSGNNSSLHLNYNGSNVGFINSYQNSELNIGTSVSAFVNFYTNNTERMRITAAGNVGIGTSSPTRKLDVAGDMTLTTGGYIYGDSTNPYLNLSQTTGTLLAYGSTSQLYLAGSVTTLSAGSNYLGLITNGSERLRITNTGNVGIGTTSPSAKLHIAKNGTYNNVSSTALRIANVTSPNKAIDFGYDNTADVGYIQGIEFGVAAKNLSLQSDGGKVGIGTTTPATKLDVSGVITATGGNSTNWNTAYGWGNHSLAGYVPQTRTLTINGTTYDLSANRSWTVSSDLQSAVNTSKVTTPVNPGANVVASFSVASYDGATFNYVLKDGTNFRAGTVVAVWNGATVQYNETTTNDIGNTTSVVLSVAISAGNAELIATSGTPGWTMKVVPIGI